MRCLNGFVSITFRFAVLPLEAPPETRTRRNLRQRRRVTSDTATSDTRDMGNTEADLDSGQLLQTAARGGSIFGKLLARLADKIATLKESHGVWMSDVGHGTMGYG